MGEFIFFLKRHYRRWFYPGILRYKIYRKLLKWKNIYKFFNMVDKSDYKRILIMDSFASSFTMVQRPQQLAKVFEKYFDMIYFRVDPTEDFKQVSDKIYNCPQVYIKNFKNKDVYYYFDSNNHRRDVKYIKKIKKISAKFIYDLIDEFSPYVVEQTSPRRIFENLHKFKPDLIITSAKKLYKDALTRFPKEMIVLATNGVTIEDFENKIPEKCPSDMLPIVDNGKPIVGYYGAFAKWLDYKLMDEVSEHYPEYNFVYIGKDIGCLKKLIKKDNVFYLGKKTYNELPSYSYYFTCCIIPFKKGRVAKATSPVKLFEYMAQQKPTVCTKDLVECYGYDGVLVSKNNEEFIMNIKKAIEMAKDENIKTKLLNYAKDNSWENKAKAIIGKIENVK